VKGSLRTRVIAGAVVWMMAVLVAVIALVVKLTRNHPEIALRHEDQARLAIVTMSPQCATSLQETRSRAHSTSAVPHR
jgi:hypothetical protein